MDTIKRSLNSSKSKSELDLNLRVNDFDGGHNGVESILNGSHSHADHVEDTYKSVISQSDSEPRTDNCTKENNKNGQNEMGSLIQQPVIDGRLGSRRSHVPNCKRLSLLKLIRHTNKLFNIFMISTAYRIGEIPKYLKEMKERIAEKSRLDAMIDPHCPPGHIALTDDERLEALSIAKKSMYTGTITSLRILHLIFYFNRIPESHR